MVKRMDAIVATLFAASVGPTARSKVFCFDASVRETSAAAESNRQ